MTQCQSYPHFIYQLFAKFLLFVAVLSEINVNQSEFGEETGNICKGGSELY